MPQIEHLWETYLAEGGQPTAEAFGIWLIRRSPELPVPSAKSNALGPSPSKVQFGSDGRPTGYDGMDHTIQAGILVARLRRFLHMQSKQTLKAVGLSEDEFNVLASLLYMPGVSKTQLLKQCIIEIPTGSELLKRMKASGLVLDNPDPEDRRSAQITISDSGREKLLRAFRMLANMDDALAPLNPEQRAALVGILHVLDAYHSERHHIQQISALMR